MSLWPVRDLNRRESVKMGTDYKKLTNRRKQTPNILAIDSPGCDDGKKQLYVAGPMLRSIAQNIIDNIPEHRHLKQANILLLIRYADATAKKLKDGERVVIGRAAKASPRDKLLAAIGVKTENQPDFVVWLSGDYLDGIGATDKGECTDNEEALKTVVALIDHELLHCGAKIAGAFVKDGLLDGYVQELDKLHIETCTDVASPDGAILVRFYSMKDNKYTFMMRKHDIEEFHGVAGRHGPWDRQLGRLIDVLNETEKTLFNTKN